MITLYTGTPGSGKSVHCTMSIINYLEEKKPVYANYALSLDHIKRIRKDRFTYLKNTEMSPDYFMQVSRAAFKPGKEGQGLIVVDEASILFNCRDFARKDRMAWIEFLQQHRHYGWDIILATQFDRMLDKQIRGFVEDEVIHRRFDNAGKYGSIFRAVKMPVFCALTYWYPVHYRKSMNFFFLKPKIAKAYNSWN